MTIIENEIQLNQSADAVYAFLADCNNHEQLMPENIYNWSSTKDEARFTIQNMAKLALKVEERIPGKEISIVPAEKAPFDVSMRWVIQDLSADSSIAKLVIEADLNMMMKMLASGPLQKLVDHQVNRLKVVLAS